MTDFHAMRKRARLAEEIIPVCLAGDLLAEHHLLQRQLDDAEKDRTDSLAGDGAAELRDRMKALDAEIRENTFNFRLRAMPRPAWQRFVNDHPPRRDDAGEIVEDDRDMKLNVDTFYDDLVRASVVDPDASDDATWQEILDSLSDFQYQEFAEACWRLNRSRIDIPLSRAASKTSQNSGGA